jgi:hypothetical protein
MERYQLLGNERNFHKISLYLAETYEEIPGKYFASIAFRCG